MLQKKFPKITFGIITLNGEPFTVYNLRTIYSFAHEIIVVEGGSKNASAYAPQGHSTDGTLEALHKFKDEEDKEGKLQIVTIDGFWEEKTKQSQAYAERATGEYLWQIDIDEFYKTKDMYSVCNLLLENPTIDGIGFRCKNFWGNFDTLVDGWAIRGYERAWSGGFPRIFRWQSGFRYINHRPPTVVDKDGRDLRKGRWISGYELARRGIFCYHYGMVFDKQARQKVSYYKNMWSSHIGMDKWYYDEFLNLKNPFKVLHGTKKYSWLKRYSGIHPEQITLLMDDISHSDKIYITIDRTLIDKTLDSRFYRLFSYFLLILEPLVSLLFKIANFVYYEIIEKNYFVANILDDIFFLYTKRFRSTRSILRFYIRQILSKFTNPNIIETGCIRDPAENTNSTFIISSLVRNRGNFWTFDINQQHLEICKKVCGEYNRFIKYIQGDSVEMLKELANTEKLAPIHLAYFDSSNDGEHILREFKTVEGYLTKGSIVIVDDIKNGGKKADRLWPYLESSKHWDIRTFELGNGTLVAKKIG